MNPVYFLKNIIRDVVFDLYKLEIDDALVERPDNKNLGDYATNIAFKISQSIGQSPMEIASKICYRISELSSEERVLDIEIKFFESVKVSQPGFINFVLSKRWLIYVLNAVVKDDTGYGSGEKISQKVMVEYTDPNPFKVFHIGHLMTNVIGESLSRLLEFSGYEVKRANYQGDVGMHVAKSIWGMERKLKEESGDLSRLSSMPLDERMGFLGKAYALGAEIFEKNSDVKAQIQEINTYVFVAAQNMLQESEDWKPLMDYKPLINGFDPERLSRVRELYEMGRSWSLEHFESLYALLGTRFDYYYFESQVGELGYEEVIKALDRGVFERDGNAVIFKGENYGLHTRVFINSFGLPTYEAKELGLAKKKYTDFPYDQSLVVTGNEIEAYFKVLLKAIDLVYPDLSGKVVHVPHGMMKLSTGKMSSRTGKVISGVDLMDEVTSAVRDRVTASGIASDDEIEDISSKIAVGAIKYGILKNGIGKDVIYDKDASLEMTGNTGAYLQYSYVRAKSIIDKSMESLDFEDTLLGYAESLSVDELDLLKQLSDFPNIVSRSTNDFAPNYICTYLFELSQLFNRFYSSSPILEAKEIEQRSFRLVLTKAVSIVLRNGLFLLGIDIVPKM